VSDQLAPSAIDIAAFHAILRSMTGTVGVTDASGLGPLRVETLHRGDARLRLVFDPKWLRPGGTVSGPMLFTLADTALYAAVLSILGLQPLAVTTDMQIRFLRKAGAVDVLAHARVLKHGRRLIVGDVTMWAEGDPRPCAHATGAYAPPAPAGDA
jgi:uncharacterized protein (TIGR00369 family)